MAKITQRSGRHVPHKTGDGLDRRKNSVGRAYRMGAFPGIGFLEPVLQLLKLDLGSAILIVDAARMANFLEPCRHHLLITRVGSRQIASRVKTALLAYYPPDWRVTLVQKAGLPGARAWRLPLAFLDRGGRFHDQTTLYIPPVKGYSLGELWAVMGRLRSAKGCPWDRKQTHHSLRQYLIEEAYEVIAAIDREDSSSLQEELGDLLLQVVFHSRIAFEAGKFNLFQVIDGITAKLRRRHPHVFGREQITTVPHVLERWEQIKLGEREKQGPRQSLLDVDTHLPSLLRAYKVQQKASRLGFDWPAPEGAMGKLKEEMCEVEDAYFTGEPAKIEEEFGDFLFAAVNVSRWLKVNPELALGKALDKFLRRFRFIEEKVRLSGRGFHDFTLEELDQWWEEAKKRGNNS